MRDLYTQYYLRVFHVAAEYRVCTRRSLLHVRIYTEGGAAVGWGVGVKWLPPWTAVRRRYVYLPYDTDLFVCLVEENWRRRQGSTAYVLFACRRVEFKAPRYWSRKVPIEPVLLGKPLPISR